MESKKFFFYELEGRGYTFQNKNWDAAKHGFEDDMLNMAWEMWSSGQAAKAQVPEGFVLVEIKDLRDVISNAGDAMMNEETSSVYDRTGEPSTWFDHYVVVESKVLKAIEAQEQSHD